MDRGAGQSAVEEVARLFDYRRKVASASDKLWYERYKPHLELYAALIVDRNQAVCRLVSGGHRLLDIGCGMGDLLVLLRDRYAELRGVDPSPDMVAQCRRNLAIRGLGERSRVAQGLAESLDHDTGSFDTVLLLDVYEHIRPAERTRALAEIRRVLRPEGELVLATPSRRVLRFWNVVDNLLLLPGRLLRGETPALWSFPAKDHPEAFVDRRELYRDLAAAGFRVEDWERVGFYPAPERRGFLGPWLKRLHRRPAAKRTLRRLFRAAATLRIANQKLLVRCTR